MVSLLGVTTTADVLKLDSPVHIGVDRGTVLRELGGPLYEDQDQIVYSLKEESDDLPNDTVRLVLQDDRVVGIDWTYPLEKRGHSPLRTCPPKGSVPFFSDADRRRSWDRRARPGTTSTAARRACRPADRGGRASR